MLGKGGVGNTENRPRHVVWALIVSFVFFLFFFVFVTNFYVLRLQMIKAIVDSRSFKSLKSDEPRRVQVLDLYCLTRFESESSSRGIVY